MKNNNDVKVVFILLASVACLSSLGCGTQSTSSSSITSSSVVNESSLASSSSSNAVRPSGDLVVAINSGGPMATFAGIEYQRDQYTRGGTTNSTEDPIADTVDDALFQTERYGVYTYEIPVSDASYDIELHFNELYQTTAGARIFSVTVEGQTLFSDLDLFSVAGHDTAYSRTLKNIHVDDGNLTIALSASMDNATLSGFAIYSETGQLEQPSFPLVEAKNPNMWADVPDMSIIRVGNNYYMSSTTMHMNPGVPIMKSTDLINWDVVNYGHQAIDSNSAKLNLDPGQEAYGEGTWASSMRFHNNTYYVSTFSNTTGKTYIYSTKNIEQGPWQTTVINRHLHDSSLFFDDDGRVYYVYGNGDISIVEVNANLSGIKAGGVDQVLIRNPASVAGSQFILKAEGSQFQKINGWYYLHNITWPQGSGRTQIVHRSRNLLGPYEGKVVLSDNTAQGCLVDTPEGNWYAYLFRDSGAVGRIPYLVPVRWENDWPVMGVNGKVPATLGFTVEDKGLSGIIRSDEFSSSTLDLVWQWNHNPDPSGWSLNARPGFMRITNTRVDKSFVETRNSLTQRMFGPTSKGVVAMDLSGMKDGDYAGIGALQDKYGFVGVARNGNQHSVVMFNGGTEIERVAINQNTIYLRVDGDFNNRADDGRFYYSLDGSNWRQIGNTLQMEYLLTHFMGYRFALFNFATKASGGFVDFDYFHVTE